MRTIKERNGRWLGYDTRTHTTTEFDSMEDAIEFRNKGILPKAREETQAFFVPTEMLEDLEDEL